MNETQNNDNQTERTEQAEQTDQLTDLEPQGEVVGGSIGPTGYVLNRKTGAIAYP